jgi:AmiR/NasT family two-component response regulator
VLDEPDGQTGRTARIAQAMGMVSIQADCTIDDALTMISNRAMVEHHTVEEIAISVIDGSIRFGE